MQARVTEFELDPLRSDVGSAVDAFRAAVVPGLREQPGYRGVLVLATPEGQGLVVSLWADEGAMAASTGFHAEQVGRFLTILRAPPGREAYEVAYSDLPPPVRD